ncbi:GntR family transcriptional regulator [Mucisphaera calidilacus]|uniref:Catabolite control protein A n=1 Tax=Mucisphaera calidilacus TaxID=2527982 RepID=A0A518BUN2_9BACT|nr:LacI family DNA-binding transcriptional regulator [Mucisphaera calidilacus]QDU70634.1 Catabolite control protein A [Mucisphaera calidilacus]
MSKARFHAVIDPNKPVSLARQVHDVLREHIEGELIGHGEQLPSMRQLSEEMSVSMAVVRQAINDLTADGYLRVDARRGVFVSKPDFKVHDIALLLPMVCSHYVTRLMKGVHDGLSGTHYRLVIEAAEANFDEQMNILSRLDRAFVSGVIIVPPPFKRYAEAIQTLRERGLPCVQSLITVDESNSAPAVVTDEFEMGRQAIALLTDAGHRQIGVLDNNTDARTSGELRLGMGSALAEIGRKLSDVPVVEGNAATLDGENPFEDGIRTAEVILERYPELTALVAVTPNRAAGALLAARRRGIRVPEDLSIVGMGGDMEGLGLMDQGITMLDRPTEAIGRRSVFLLQQLIEGDQPTYRSVQLQPVLRERGSIGAPRGSV